MLFCRGFVSKNPYRYKLHDSLIMHVRRPPRRNYRPQMLGNLALVTLELVLPKWRKGKRNYICHPDAMLEHDSVVEICKMTYYALSITV